MRAFFDYYLAKLFFTIIFEIKFKDKLSLIELNRVFFFLPVPPFEVVAAAAVASSLVPCKSFHFCKIVPCGLPPPPPPFVVIVLLLSSSTTGFLLAALFSLIAALLLSVASFLRLKIQIAASLTENSPYQYDQQKNLSNHSVNIYFFII